MPVHEIENGERTPLQTTDIQLAPRKISPLQAKIQFIEDHFHCFDEMRSSRGNSDKNGEGNQRPTNAFGYLRNTVGCFITSTYLEYLRISYQDEVEDVISLMEEHWLLKVSRPRQTHTSDCDSNKNPILEECWHELLKQQPTSKGSESFSPSELHSTHKGLGTSEINTLAMIFLGGAEDFTLEQCKENLFKTGLLKALSTMQPLIVTTSLDYGTVRILGEVLSDYDLQTMDLSWNRLRCLGIVPWRWLFRRDLYARNNYENEFDGVYASVTICEPPVVPEGFLQCNHTHYLLVDDDDRSTTGEKSVNLCAEVFNRLSERWKMTVIVIVLNGGLDVIKSIRRFVQKGFQVFVCSGTGRAADLVSTAHKLRLEYTKFNSFGHRHSEQLKDTVRKLLEPESDVDDILEMLTKIVEKPSLITICDLNTCQNLDVDIFHAVFTAMNRRTSDQLRLALSWNRVDMAEQAFSRGGTELEAEDLYPLLLDALLEDKADFTKVVLQNEVHMSDFLTLKRLHQLYYPIRTEKRELEPGFSEFKNDQLFLSLLIKVLKRHLGSFSSELYEYDSPEVHTRRSDWERRFQSPFQELFLWALLTRRKSIALFAWERSENRLILALMACVINHSLSKSIPHYDTECRQFYNEWIETFESLSVGVLEECHRRDPELTQLMLMSKNSVWGGFDCLELAAVGDRKLFCSTTAYQTALTFAWTNGIRTRIWSHLLAIFCPLVLLASDRYFEFKISSSSRIDLRQPESQRPSEEISNSRSEFLRKTKRFYTAPVTKCLLDSVVLIAFLVLFSCTLLFRIVPSSITTEESCVMAYFFCFFVDVVRRIILVSRSTLGFKRYIQLYGWFLLDMLIIPFVLVSMLLRIGLSDTFDFAKACYAITLILCYSRIFALYGAVPSLGPKIVMIQRMLKEVGPFFLILVVILLAYGVSLHALLYPNRTVFDWSALRDVVYYPYWNLYGELQLDYVFPKKANCTEESSDPTCSRFNLAPCFLACYMLISGILLMNLLIAIFSNIYEEMEKISIHLWKHNRYALFITYKMATVLPVPFSIIETTLDLIGYLYGVCKPKPVPSGLIFRDLRAERLARQKERERNPIDPLKSLVSKEKLIERLEAICTNTVVNRRAMEGSKATI